MDEHLGYEARASRAATGATPATGTRSKTVITEVGPVEIDVPRDRDGTFEPQIVRKRQRRLSGVDEMVISLTAKGLTTGEVAAHLAEVYGAEVSRETISKITDRVLERAWPSGRPGRSTASTRWCSSTRSSSRSATARSPTGRSTPSSASPSTANATSSGLWVGDGGEGAKYWLQVLTEIKNRGVEDVCIVVCDGLKGCRTRSRRRLAAGDRADLRAAPDPQQLPLRAASATGTSIARDLDPSTPPPTEKPPGRGSTSSPTNWGEQYPAIIRLWENAWAEFVPFLAYNPEIRRVIYSHQRDREPQRPVPPRVRARGHFPNEQAALKCLYLTVRSLDPTGRGRATLDQPLEARPQRLRHHLRRPNRAQQLTN